MKASIIYVVIAALFAFSHVDTQNSGELLKLDLTKMLKAKASKNTTDIFKLIDFVPLETKPECLTGIGRTVVTKDEIYLFSKDQQGILIFDRKGKFLRKIGKLGRGPGEFCVALPLDIRCWNNSVYVFDIGCFKVVEYSTDGKNASDIFLEGQPHIRECELLNDTCFLVAQTFPLHNKKAPYYELTSFDFSGKRIHQFSLEPSSKEYKTSQWPFIFWHFNNNLFYKSTYCDFVYKVLSPNKSEKVFELSPGKKRNIPDGRLTFGAAPGMIEIISINETSDYLLLSYFYGTDWRDAVYNKKTGEFYQIQTKYGETEKIETCSFLWPNTLLPNHSNVPGEFVAFLQPVHLAALDINKLNIKSATIKSKLLNLQSIINVEDNPVVVLMKEKS
ncbi:6-bladed beta-propeller [Maribellus comscasis]|uniref:6-bladed beta-propeller n=1 Tax=Maribellus comscasis TaxID=2681766 RepID=A0A6I6JWI1_9BACT|nr:6-bladed beta-propeller [Maribellus comscasis]QGY46991.1 6-bladed beta-propeller [Maribellus comscasis]